MISTAQLQADVCRLLEAGPPKWTATGPALTEEARWLARRASDEKLDRASVVVAFADKFKTRGEPEWPALAERVRAFFDLLSAQKWGYKNWKGGMTKDMLDVAPAAEVIVIFGDDPGGWREKWQRLGGSVVEGRCVALKKDPIWVSFSEFRQPYGPYEWTGRLGQEDLMIGEAEQFGLMAIAPSKSASPASGCLILLAPIMVVGWVLIRAIT